MIATCYFSSPVAGQQLQYYENSDGQLAFSFGENCIEDENSKRPYKAIVTKVYDTTGDGGVDMVDVAELFKSGENELTELNGDGDFRSTECIELLKEADIVATNPPFSLFREYIATLMDYEKSFIIIGSTNAISMKEIFPLMQSDKMWLGAPFQSGNAYFIFQRVLIPLNMRKVFMIQKHAELNSVIVVGILIWIFVLDMKNDTCEKVFSRGVPFIRKS